MSILSILLQAPEGAAMGGAANWVFIIAIIVVFYFFMIRPQQKKQKEIQKARDAIQTGDKVITSGGIHGKVKEINDSVFVIEIADNVKIKIDKASVFALHNASK
jgi:preprotein translocase subunit YajC